MALTPQPLVWMHSGIDKSPKRTGQASLPHSLIDCKKITGNNASWKDWNKCRNDFFVSKIASMLLCETQIRRLSNTSQERMKTFTSRQHMFNKIKETVWLYYQLWFLVDIWDFHSIFMWQSTWKHVSIEIVPIQHATESDTKQSKRNKAIKISKRRRAEETVSKH